MKRPKRRSLRLIGTPNERQRLFFEARTRYIAYGGARGGGKSWALRRKLILLCLNYPGISCLIIRRSYPELSANHIMPLCAELDGYADYSEIKKRFVFPGGSSIKLGYCSSQRDTLRYQGLQYDIIAIDEATQLTEYQFNTFKACLRGTNKFPKRIYLTCNPGGVGHSWVKRLFVERSFRSGENPADYTFIPAKVFDNTALMESCPEYADALRSIADPKLRRAWLDGDWNVFEGQFFSEFDLSVHVLPYGSGENIDGGHYIVGMDYGFDMLALVLLRADAEHITVEREYYESGLTIPGAAAALSRFTQGFLCDYVSASPDLWGRRQDSGQSGVVILESAGYALPPVIRADNRRVLGWLRLRSAFRGEDGRPLRISERCPELIRCIQSLTYDRHNPDDASDTPHSITHLPEALRYAVMSIGDSAAEEEAYPDFRPFSDPSKRLCDY